MQIGVDYTAAVRQGGGIGRYARELLHALVAAGKHTYLVLAATAGMQAAWVAQRTSLLETAANRSHLAFYSIPLTDDWLSRLWQRLRIPLRPEWVMPGLDAFFSPDFVLPPLKLKTCGILTVHDLSYLRHPETFPPALRRYLEQAVPRSVQRADHVLADSNATRNDLISLLGVPPGKVSTLHLGVNRAFGPTASPHERQKLQARYGLGESPYILAVGTVQPRKNYITLMEACDSLITSRRFDLVIVGQTAWLSTPILEAAAKRPYVRILGFVDDNDLPAFYRQAELLAFPSLYEGFGLPPLEAMACGTPVIASSASSIPEAVGDAGLLIDPLNVEGWRESIRQVLNDPLTRDRLRTSGLAWSRHFTWERTAAQWLDIVESITAYRAR